MEVRIEVVSEGSYADAFKEGVTWLPEAKNYGKATIEVTPTKQPNLKKVVITYQRKESNHE